MRSKIKQLLHEVTPYWADSLTDYLMKNGLLIPIRCKDCKYSVLPGKLTQRYGLPGALTCKNENSPCHCRNTLGTDYCPYGKRKDNG